jgi:hypothetical protein
MSLGAAVRALLQKAAVDNGFGIERPADGDWLSYDALAAPAELRLTHDGTHPGGAWIAATNHAGVVAELARRWPRATIPAPAGSAAFGAPDGAGLDRLVGEIWRLARALPEEPLHQFEKQTADLPRTTEAERLVIARVGQNIFRDALLLFWNGCCAVTQVAEPRLLRASHIIPWAKCESDADRLDATNGLLLAAHLDAAFDAGLISFADDGTILVSPQLSDHDRAALGITEALRLTAVGPGHQKRLAWHREHIFLRDSE